MGSRANGLVVVIRVSQESGVCQTSLWRWGSLKVKPGCHVNKARPGSAKCKARHRHTCVVAQARTKAKHLSFSAAPEPKRGGPKEASHSFLSQFVLFTAAGSKVTQLHYIRAGLGCQQPKPYSKATEFGGALIELKLLQFLLFCILRRQYYM